MANASAIWQQAAHTMTNYHHHAVKPEPYQKAHLLTLSSPAIPAQRTSESCLSTSAVLHKTSCAAVLSQSLIFSWLWYFNHVTDLVHFYVILKSTKYRLIVY